MNEIRYDLGTFSEVLPTVVLSNLLKDWDFLVSSSVRVITPTSTAPTYDTLGSLSNDPLLNYLNKIISKEDSLSEFKPKTNLARKLLDLRREAIKKGMHLLNEKELSEFVADLRNEKR
jgi:hypothetical protein